MRLPSVSHHNNHSPALRSGWPIWLEQLLILGTFLILLPGSVMQLCAALSLTTMTLFIVYAFAIQMSLVTLAGPACDLAKAYRQDPFGGWYVLVRGLKPPLVIICSTYGLLAAAALVEKLLSV